MRPILRTSGFIAAVGDAVDGPNVGPVPPTLSDRLDLPVRLLLGLVTGVALCFVWDYLDDSIRGRDEMESLGIRCWPKCREEGASNTNFEQTGGEQLHGSVGLSTYPA